MEHKVGKDIYKKLGKKIDGLHHRASINDTFYSILKELYTREEAEVIVKMPYRLSTLDRISDISGFERARLRKILGGLCAKGLVVDLFLNDEYYYVVSPMVIGIFEFTMMRRGKDLNYKKWARLFYEYMEGDDSFVAKNYKNGEKVSLLRTLPVEETIESSDYVEILDYERAIGIVEGSDKFSIGYCSCRHEKMHIGEKECDFPIETCSSFGVAADFLIRNDLAREVSKSEMLENIARSRELGLVLEADNVKKNVTAICHCCGCCCNALLGITKLGNPNILVSSTFIAAVNQDSCTGCGICAKACPIDAIEMVPISNPTTKKKHSPEIDMSLCLGCGVCTLKCKPNALKLVKREKRVIHPETTFERVILQCLEKGTLQNQIFDNPSSMTQKVMRGIVGSFLKFPPTKKALMSDILRSSFLKAMKKNVQMRGMGWMTEL